MVHDIATYLTTPPILSPTGGFYASEDADSAPSAYDTEHKEGAFYVWTTADFHRAINDDRIAAICAAYYNLKDDGNISPRYDVQGELEGQNTLCVVKELSDLAAAFSLPQEDAQKAILEGKKRLSAWRERERPRPHLDDKIVVSWNGLAISGLARTAAALAALDPEASSHYLQAAQNAASFIRRELYDEQTNSLRRVYREGPGDTSAFAEDFAFLISGLIDLYEATFDDTYLAWADCLQKKQLELFYDKTAGGFFGTPEGQQDVLIRSKDAMDNAEPSANGTSAQNLFRLAALLGDEGYEKTAKKTVRAFEVEMVQHPGLFTGLMSGVVCGRLGIKPIVVSGPDDSPEVQEALRTLRGVCRPSSTIVRIGGGAKSEWLATRNDIVANIDGKREMVQICEGTSCRLVKAGELVELLKGSHV